jgi:predicted dehydrogenase
MNKVGIFGSGFGLYGYLPALLSSFDVTVLLPRRYKNRLSKRDDLSKFLSQIQWVDHEMNVLDKVDTIVIAQRPFDQVGWVREILTRKTIKRLLLEKPIAPNPLIAIELLSNLISSEKIFRIGYLFRHTLWGQNLLRLAKLHKLCKPIYITWIFKANHYFTDAPNWKKMVSEGGGALRFFGIHLIGLLAEIGYSRVDKSEITYSHLNEAERWDAVFSGYGLPEVHVSIDSNSQKFKRFTVRDETTYFESKDPFLEFFFSENEDRRIGPLRNLCNDLINGKTNNHNWYMASVELWHKSEIILTHKIR